MIFDNTSARLPKGQSPGLHLAFRAGGRKFLYCYIRKNACSSFKRLIVSRSSRKDRLGRFPSRLEFMRHFHAPQKIDTSTCDHSIVIIRDPLDRVVSAWKNKFIQRNGHEDMFANYARVTGQDPETASFDDFMTRYIGRPFEALDIHVRPQSHDLAPVVYSDAVLLPDLHSHMTGLVGPRIADRFFLQPINSTSGPAAPDSAETWTRSASDLHAAFREHGTIPATRSFLTPAFRERVAALYADDYRIFGTVSAAPRSVTPVPTAPTPAAEQET